MFVPKSTFTQGVWPVVATAFCAALCTTTPATEDNCYLARVNSRTDSKGDPLLPTLRFGKPCKDCSLTKAPWKCVHNTGEQPPWKNLGKQAEMTFLYEESIEDFMRENFAMGLDRTEIGFPPNSLAELELLPVLRITLKPRMLMIACDPAHSGSCKFAITAGYIEEDDTFVVTGLDAQNIERGDPKIMQQMLQQMIYHHRQRPEFKDVPILFCPENAPGPMGGMLAHLIRRAAQPFLTMREYGTNRAAGVPKDEKKTMTMALQLIERVRSKKIRFMDQMIGGEHMRKYLVSQMAEFSCKIKSKQEDPFFKTKFTWAGAKEDDLIDSTMMLPFWWKWFWESDFEGYTLFKRYVLKTIRVTVRS